MAKRGINRSERRSLVAYRRWDAMKQRCLNPSSRSYKYYGGRGIKVCKRWLSFDLFLEDMGEPDSCLSLERIDNNKGYEPGNCRWDTCKNQANNTRRNHRITINGETRTVQQWADLSGLKANTILTRIRRGWAADEAVGLKAGGEREERIAAREDRKMVCACCGGVFYPRKNQIDAGQGKYCSRKCSLKHAAYPARMRKRDRTIETK